VAALVLLLALAGCTAIQRATAAPGLRPGVDVPSDPRATGSQPLGTPAPTTGQGGYAFMSTHADGSPVAFDPCRQVHVVVNPAHEPPGARDVLLRVLGKLTTASGLQFVVDGETTEVMRTDRRAYQPDVYGDSWAPVLITWDLPASPLLGDGVLGRAGPLPFAGREPDSARWVSGQAVFNAPALAAQMELGRDDDAEAVLLHELGHVVGLAHVTDPFQVMFDTNSYPLSSYRAGDRRGLELLGMGRCYDDY
jgi:hypothetical protein